MRQSLYYKIQWEKPSLNSPKHKGDTRLAYARMLAYLLFWIKSRYFIYPDLKKKKSSNFHRKIIKVNQLGKKNLDFKKNLKSMDMTKVCTQDRLKKKKKIRKIFV